MAADRDRSHLRSHLHHDGEEDASFEDSVKRVLAELRPGDVVTYGEVAAEAGFPGAAAVGRLLATSDGAHPWWRVVTASGRLVPGLEEDHARRLRAEGITVVNNRVRSADRGHRHDGSTRR